MLPLVLLAGLLQANAPDAEVVAQLRARDEALLAAVHNGGRAAWEKATTPDFLYVEEGDVTPRAQFLAELEPDGSEPLKIRSFEGHVYGDLALVVHRDDAPAEAGATRPAGQYLMTETWQRIDGQWKLHLVHIDAVRTDPPALQLTLAQLDELAGTYRSGAKTYVLRREGTRLLGARNGGVATEQKAETRDVLFTPGETRSRKVFERGADGKVTGFVRRDENSDVLWLRVP